MGGFCWYSDEEPNAWIMFDFKKTYITPTHYVMWSLYDSYGSVNWKVDKSENVKMWTPRRSKKSRISASSVPNPINRIVSRKSAPIKDGGTCSIFLGLNYLGLSSLIFCPQFLHFLAVSILLRLTSDNPDVHSHYHFQSTVFVSSCDCKFALELANGPANILYSILRIFP